MCLWGEGLLRSLTAALDSEGETSREEAFRGQYPDLTMITLGVCMPPLPDTHRHTQRGSGLSESQNTREEEEEEEECRVEDLGEEGRKGKGTAEEAGQ